MAFKDILKIWNLDILKIFINSQARRVYNAAIVMYMQQWYFYEIHLIVRNSVDSIIWNVCVRVMFVFFKYIYYKMHMLYVISIERWRLQGVGGLQPYRFNRN